MSFDIVMPFAVFCVTIVSMFLNEKVEKKLKSVLEQREFSVIDAALFVGLIAVMVFLVVFVRQLSLILMALFLFGYSVLLFTFTYLFSKNRWYVAIIPPLTFILLYVFLRDTPLWIYYLGNIYGIVFAVLITLYVAGLFTWKTTFVFGILLTGIDIILVLVTGTMVEAANVARGLSLPVLVTLQTFPPVMVDERTIFMSLGLGDFFFAGLLAIQTFKKLGRKYAILSVVAMTISFFAFEAVLLTLLPTYGSIPFPGTLMIISGWLPIVAVGTLAKRSRPFT